MKKMALMATLLIAGFSMSQAQNNKSGWGLRGGLNFPMDGMSISQASNNITSVFTGESLSTGWHAGLYGRVYAGNRLYFGSNLLYLNNETTFTGKNEGTMYKETLNRSAAQMDLVTGIRMLGVMRVQTGVSGLMYVSNSWSNTFDNFGTGYNVGVGIDLWRVSFDVTYHGSFNSQSGEWKGIPLNYNRSDLMLGMSIRF